MEHLKENPSLNDLYNIINNYEELSDYEKEFFNKDNFKAIYEYILNEYPSFYRKKDTKENILVKNFWLGGHIKVNINEEITDDLMKLIEKKIDNIDYSLCWGSEIYSVMDHNNRFMRFKTIYDNYKEYYNHIKYSPDNSGYLEAKERFENNIKMDYIE